MGNLRRFLQRLINVIRPGRGEAGLEREIASHLVLLEDEYRRRGLPAAEARRSARLALGGIDQTKELHRDARTLRWLADARRDATYAVRLLRHHPIVTLTAALSLAIGIGINAAIFTVFDWVLIRPLPYPAAHELVRVFTAGTAPVTGPTTLTYDDFTTFRHATAIREAAAFTIATRVMAGAGIDPVHVAVARIAGDLFVTLGVYPEVGRGFTTEETAAGAPVVVLGHDLWQRRFSGDRTIVGRTVFIDGSPHTVVGIMPSHRGYPGAADVWRPLTASEREDDDRELSMIARLRRDTTVERASTEIATSAQLAANGARTAWAEDLRRTDVADISAALQSLVAAAMLTLLIACANVAALVGARGVDRAREIAVRGALGATRARVLGQLISESLVLSLAGGLAGLLSGRWARSHVSRCVRAVARGRGQARPRRLPPRGSLDGDPAVRGRSRSRISAGLSGSRERRASTGSLLHGVDPADRLPLTIAPLLLGAMGMLAALLAAARVGRADPAATLRSE